MNLDPVMDESAPLLAGLRRGDDHAFATLVRQHGGRMLATARRLLRDDDEAEDAVQEAFVSAARAIDGFAGDSKLSTWLHRIVVNTALMRLRSRRRRREEPIDDLLPRFDADGHHAEGVVGWETPSDVLLERRQTRAMVRRCIDELPERYRTVILLRDIEEMDTEETAHSIGSTPNAVKIRLHRARQALRTLLARELGRSEHASDDAPALAVSADQGRRRA
ncbi:MAG: sigma-70 family RNA polymerase sigma factor [Deltaproteobacteria bacterium]|nr:MAG: sigma-70 family RNA polymerase sigma factor [Deltaproteobacteria bacterium]